MENDPNDIQALFKQLALGSKEAFRIIYLHLYEQVWATAMAYGKSEPLAEDITQQVFMKLWERRQELAGLENPVGWLSQAARFQVVDAIRREWSKQDYLEKVSGRIQFFEQDDPLAQAIKREHKMLLENALEELSPRQQVIFKMSREEGYTYEEIAGKLGIGKETVKEHLTRALKTLRVRLKDLVLLLALIPQNFF